MNRTRIAAASIIAAVVVGSGATGAVAQHMITGRDIQNGTVKGRDLASDVIGRRQLRPGVVQHLRADDRREVFTMHNRTAGVPTRRLVIGVSGGDRLVFVGSRDQIGDLNNALAQGMLGQGPSAVTVNTVPDGLEFREQVVNTQRVAWYDVR